GLDTDFEAIGERQVHRAILRAWRRAYRNSGRFEEAFGIVDLEQATLADLEIAGGDAAREEAVVAHEQAGDVLAPQLRLEGLLAVDVEMVGRLVEQIEVGPQQLHLEEEQAGPLAVAQHLDRLAEPRESEAGGGQRAHRLPLAHAVGLGDVVEDRLIDWQAAHA